MDHKEMIEKACESYAFPIQSWEAEDDRPRANLGRFRVTEDDEDHGLYADAEGVLKASVVGAEEYGNLHVAFYFYEDDMDDDAGTHVTDPAMSLLPI